MVRRPDMVITVSGHCDVCGRRFVEGDHAVMNIRLPDGGSDTVCVEDWQEILKAAAAYLREHGDTPRTPPETLLEEVQRILNQSDDS